MPVRMLRPGLRTSERYNHLRYWERCFYVSLFSLVDDFGRYEANPVLLGSECFPYGDENGIPMTRGTMEGGLRKLASQGLIVVYEVNGKQLLQFENWKERARAASKYPGPEAGKVIYKSEPVDLGDDAAEIESTTLEQEHQKKVACSQLPANDSNCQQMLPPKPSSSPKPSPTPQPVPASVCVALRSKLNGLYGRKPEQPWSYIEESTLIQIADRPEAEAELTAIEQYKATMKEPRYFPQSLARLLETWTEVLDKSRAGNPAVAKSNGPSLSKVKAYAQEKWGDDSRWQNWACSFHAYWADPKRNWRHKDGRTVDWMIELGKQVNIWRPQTS